MSREDAVGGKNLVNKLANVSDLLETYFDDMMQFFDGHQIGTRSQTNSLMQQYEKLPENGLKTCLSMMCLAINHPDKDWFSSYFREENSSKRFFFQLLDLCSLEPRCNFLDQIKRVSSLDDDILRKHIGEYFREKTNSYLYENYKDTYAEILRERGFAEVLEQLQKSESRSEEKSETRADVLQFSAAPAPTILASDEVANDGSENSSSATSVDSHAVIFTAESVLHGRNLSHHEPNHEEGQSARSPSPASVHHVVTEHHRSAARE